MTAQVLIIGGPTASGKSGLALALAKEFDAVVLSADAMTVYRGLDIGTAKPTADELRAVRHFGIDVRDPNEEFSVSDFVALFDSLCRTTARLIVAGGTPFYLSALVRPMAEMPSADPAVRARLEARTDLWTALHDVDPITAARLHPNDRVRIVRALEVHEITGRPLSAVHADGAKRAAFSGPVAWLDQDGLRERIDRRLAEMLDDRYLDETARALDIYGDSARPLRSFAYKHFVAHLQGTVDLDEAMRCTARDTWRLARKQRTWGRGLDLQTTSPDEVRQMAATVFAPG